jgi:methylated-DNA-protein-cysteine methyltransferase related protein
MTRIHAVVRKIPRGSVATYGEIAALAGFESGHRVAAQAMRVCPEGLPWQRVLGKKDARRGQINIGEPDHRALQRALLEAEGVRFDPSGFVALREHGWLWQSAGRAPIPKKGSRSGSKRAKKKASASRARSPARAKRRA